MTKLLPLLLLTACKFGKVPVAEPVEPSTPWEELQAIDKTYRELIGGEQDGHGFVYTDHCDSLIFSALLASVGVEVEVEAARVGGRWYRRPSHDCYQRNESGSSISRDGLLAVIEWAYRNDRPGVLEDIAVYGRDNDWVMGEGDLTATYFNPHMRMLLLTVYRALTGEDLDVGLAGWLFGYTVGYQANLFLLQANLLSDIDGEVSSEVYEIAFKHYQRNPDNPWYSFVYHKLSDGDFSEPISQLLAMYPPDRLPTNRDWCDEWVVQREAGDDWQSCNRTHQHVGGPLIYITEQIRRALNGRE